MQPLTLDLSPGEILPSIDNVSSSMGSLTPDHIKKIRSFIEELSSQIGFSEVGFCHLDVSTEIPKLKQWLSNHYHGDMQWMENHLELRSDPSLLLPGALSAIVVRLDYLPPQAQFAHVLGNPQLAYISRYALGRDYHKIMRKRLSQLGDLLKEALHQNAFDLPIHYRPFVDSAPVLERSLAAKAGLGWVGKHSLLINNEAGSWFFIGELLINLPLHLGNEEKSTLEHSLCGKCKACRTLCPTNAIVEDYVIDARRCISYLTIENKGPIPLELRPLIGNRIYGCDDCQLICPHNQSAPLGQLEALIANKNLKAPSLLSLWAWDEEKFLTQTLGSPIRRIGFHAWLRNIAVALGNIPYETHESLNIISQLQSKKGISPLIDEHIDWAIERHTQGDSTITQKHKRLVRSIQRGLSRDA